MGRDDQVTRLPVLPGFPLLPVLPSHNPTPPSGAGRDANVAATERGWERPIEQIGSVDVDENRAGVHNSTIFAPDIAVEDELCEARTIRRIWSALTNIPGTNGGRNLEFNVGCRPCAG